MRIEDRVRDVLRTRGNELSPEDDAWSQIERRLDGAVAPVPHESRRRVVAAVVALLIALAGSLLLVEAFRNRTTPGLPRPTATSNGLIAFGGRDNAIWTMNPDGTGLTELRNLPIAIAELHPAFSPDGSRIAFDGYPRNGAVFGGANYDIYVMNADGSGARNLTTSPRDVASGASQSLPEWSPDGTKLLYASDDGLYVMNADGSHQTKIAVGSNGAWSPDGSGIAFAHEGNIAVVAPDGGGLTQLARDQGTPGRDYFPTWLPDGRRVLYLRTSRQGSTFIVVDLDGRGRPIVTLPSGVEAQPPEVSPNGASFVYYAYIESLHTHRIFSASFDTGRTVDLTSSTGVDETNPIWSPDGTLLAFQRSTALAQADNVGTFDIFTMKPDGSEVRRLTSDAGASGYDLSWQQVNAQPQPSGGRITFSRGRPEGGIYVMEPDGTGLTRITSDGGDADAVWSPDGSEIAFIRSDQGNANIYVMQSDGSQIRRLTSDGAGGSPAWSPDGTRIAFTRETPGNDDIYLMEVDGSHVTRLTSDLLLEYTPVWSPDGSMIAFVANSPGPPPSPVDLYLMNADGSGMHRIGPDDVALPSWSPDGTRITFVDETTGSIFEINPDGTGLRRLVDVPALIGGGFYPPNFTSRPPWSPDGTRFVFSAGDTKSSHVWAINADGSEPTQLTSGPVWDANPAWGGSEP